MARVTPGNYVPLDVNYARDGAIRRAGEAAELLFLRSLAYAKSAKTDGLIPNYDLPVVAVGMKAVATRVKALVREGLWLPVEGGWIIRSWQRWNGDDESDAQSVAGTFGNHRRWHAQRGVTDPGCDHCSTSVPDIGTRSLPDSPPDAETASGGESQGKGREVTTTKPSVSRTDTAQTSIGEWLDHCRQRPPERVIGQVAKHVRELLAEGIDPGQVRAGLAAWHSKSLHPSTLPSIVNEVMNGTPKAATTDQRVAAGLALAARYAEEDTA